MTPYHIIGLVAITAIGVLTWLWYRIWGRNLHPQHRLLVVSIGAMCMALLLFFGNPANASVTVPLMAVIFTASFFLAYQRFRKYAEIHQ